MERMERVLEELERGYPRRGCPGAHHHPLRPVCLDPVQALFRPVQAGTRPRLLTSCTDCKRVQGRALRLHLEPCRQQLRSRGVAGADIPQPAFYHNRPCVGRCQLLLAHLPGGALSRRHPGRDDSRRRHCLTRIYNVEEGPPYPVAETPLVATAIALP